MLNHISVFKMTKILFETSFEVCNLVGGIHTVVLSKIESLQKYFDTHILIGPWFKENQKEFIQASQNEVPKEIQTIFDNLSKQNIFCAFGHWDIKEKPEVILIDSSKFQTLETQNYFKQKYWEHFKVDSLYAGWDFIEPLIFSTTAGIFIEEYIKQNSNNTHVDNEDTNIAQFHEWMTGFGGLYLKLKEIETSTKLNVKTIFTTHATMLGRALTGNNRNINELKKDKNFSPINLSKEVGVLEKFTAEKACATYCDEFTTVSKITQSEANLIFDKKPKLTYNGININNFPKGKELFYEQVKSKNRIINFLEKIFPNENFNEHLLVFTSGRPEFHNKGFDSILKSLKNIQDNNQKICMFFLVPWKHYELKSNFEITTHWLDNEENHPIIKYAKELNLNNKGNTKIILYPCYIGTNEDKLFNDTYYNVTSGFDLGVFPSSYEPWGYTPLESITCGVPAITSDSTGFGDFFKTKKPKGLKIIKKNNTEIEQITKIIETNLKLNSEERLKASIDAFETAKKCSWENFITQYIDVYGLNKSKKN